MRAARHADIAPDVIPAAVYVAFQQQPGEPLRTQVRDQRTGELLMMADLRETADWLGVLGFSYVPGTAGIWSRSC